MMKPNDTDPVKDALTFREVRIASGRALIARGADGSLYAYGRPTPDAPLSAWRQTPAGDRQWLAFAVAGQHEGTQALRRTAEAVARGDSIAVMDWPIWAADGTASDRRTPVRITRDAVGIRFEPLAHGTEPFTVHAGHVESLLAGRLHARIPGTSSDLAGTTARLVVGLRDAKGILTRGERLRAGGGLVVLSSDLRERDPSRRLLVRCLDRFSNALAPMLDLHRPNRTILDIAASALAPLRDAPAGILGPQGRAWVGGEAAPLLAMLEGRLRAHERERSAANENGEEHEVRGPALA